MDRSSSATLTCLGETLAGDLVIESVGSIAASAGSSAAAVDLADAVALARAASGL